MKARDTKINYSRGHNRPGQTRPDQTRPDQGSRMDYLVPKKLKMTDKLSVLSSHCAVVAVNFQPIIGLVRSN